MLKGQPQPLLKPYLLNQEPVRTWLVLSIAGMLQQSSPEAAAPVSPGSSWIQQEGLTKPPTLCDMFPNSSEHHSRRHTGYRHVSEGSQHRVVVRGPNEVRRCKVGLWQGRVQGVR